MVAATRGAPASADASPGNRPVAKGGGFRGEVGFVSDTDALPPPFAGLCEPPDATSGPSSDSPPAEPRAALDAPPVDPSTVWRERRPRRLRRPWAWRHCWDDRLVTAMIHTGSLAAALEALALLLRVLALHQVALHARVRLHNNMI